MTLRRTLTALALGVMALTLFMGCVEPGPPPPVVMVEPPPPESMPPLFFVNTSNLAVREGPTTAAPQIGVLQFNDEVNVLETSGGWGRIYNPSRNMSGWASMRYLQPVPANRPRSVPKRRAPAPSEPATPAPTPKAM